MPSGKLYSLAKMNTATTGTGTITLSTVASGFITFANAGVSNGETVTYCIEDGANREVGYGVYTSSGTTLTRNVLRSTNSNNAINLSGTAVVGITAAAENFYEWFRDIDANGFNLGMDDNTGINDDSGNEVVRFRKTSSAVNYVEILNTATGTGPSLKAVGDDTDIDLNLEAKGTGRVRATNATLVTPALGTPSSGTLTSCTGLPLSTGVTGTLAVANGGTGQTTEAEAVGELIQACTEDTAPDNAADFFGVYDASADTGKKVKFSTVIREKLTAARTYYVRTDGSDSNTGLVDSAGGAFLTLQKAIDTLETIDCAGFDVVIDLGNGTYTATTTMNVPVIGGNLTIRGDTGTPGNVILNSGGTLTTPLTFTAGVVATIEGVQIGNGAANTGTGLSVTNGAFVTLNGVNFGEVSAAHISAADQGRITISASYTISGAGTSHWNCAVGGIIRCQSRTITITGTPAFGSAFAFAQLNAVQVVNGNTFSGSATGVRYDARSGAVIFTSGGGATYLPGGTAGTTTASGTGQYI